MVVGYSEAIWTPVRNYTSGRLGHLPVAVVNHISEGTEAGAISWFNNPTSDVSSHYFICKDGRIRQFVNEVDTAWCNGINFSKSYSEYNSDLSIPWIWDCWNKGVNPNLVTISIEYEGFSNQPLTSKQLDAAIRLHIDIFKRHNWEYNPTRICGHFQVDRVNKINCPGPYFPWDTLRKEVYRGLTKVDPITDCLNGLWHVSILINERGHTDLAIMLQQEIVELKQVLGRQ